jgi:cytochrome P450
MTDTLLRPAVAAPAILVFGYLVYTLLLKPQKLPNIPVIGERKDELFSRLRAKLRNAKDFKAAVIYAYKNHKHEAVLLPAFGVGNVVLLPLAETQWIIEQPSSVLSVHDQAMESLQTDYTVPDPLLVRQPFHQKLIVTSLTQQVGNLIPDVADECEWSFEKYWGFDKDKWTEVGVYDTMRRVIGHVTNRVFVGLPHSRNMKLVDLGMAFAQDIPQSAMLLRLFWWPFRALAALFITIPNRLHERQFARILKPEIEQRLADYDRRDVTLEKQAKPEPNDFLQWNLKAAKASGIPYESNWRTLAGRVLLLNFAAIHTSSFSITGAILDLVYSKKEYIHELRAEIENVLSQHGGVWSKHALAKMDKLDSTLRESARLNSFVTIGVMRLVVAPEGVKTPSGIHLPHGTLIAAHSHPLLREAELYEDPLEFKPFRFAERRHEEGVEYVKRARNAFATTSNEYLAFGHGRDACPGRFFAANELKLLLGHALMNYDFEMQTGRPENIWVILNLIPPMKATVRVKRRATS